jgi:catechol 2,3-dioxygenase-like lactoylglutathione lyase family enzyme
MITRIDHTTISVSDIQRSVAFYTTYLGFTIDHEMLIPESRLRIVFLRLGDTILELFGVAAVSGIMVSEVNEIVGYKHICLLVDSVDREYARLARAGVFFRIPPTTIQDSVRIAFLKDPDGMDIELIEYLAKEGA